MCTTHTKPDGKFERVSLLEKHKTSLIIHKSLDFFYYIEDWKQQEQTNIANVKKDI